MRYVGFVILIGLLIVILFSNILNSAKHSVFGFVSDPSFFEPAPIVKKVGSRQFVLARLYSTHPFNYRNLVAISLGSRSSSIKPGDAVTTDGQTLIGQVVEVNPDYSLVKTIFDSEWSLPVRIGAKAADGLLIGRQDPLVTTIEKSQGVMVGDPIYSAGREFPLGMKIGVIKEIYDSPTIAFIQAKVGLDYNFNQLRELWVLSN
ncbi:MAG: Uncharacterized protein G01um10143_805 [Parcubacteria group bacterium Gr01-1014_3]|nr:MAG: Uncharacterized protein G01um10143_805 [Parcubacteria group bacterium Gr01-1014_3]